MSNNTNNEFFNDLFSPNIIGMLWNVTSLDADNLARAMLNVWLPGNPINLHSKFKV